MKSSAIIITKNEEENISDCVKTLSFASEIVIIDNASEDKTIQIAQKLGAKVHKISGLDFSYLRNIGKEKAHGEWLFYIDADERVSGNLAEEITKMIADGANFSAYTIPRKNYFFGKSWPGIEKMIRLIRKDALIGWQGSLHESPMVTGKIGKLKSFLLHYTHNDLSLMVKKTNEWSEIEAQLRYKNNHPRVTWWRFFRVMSSSFWSSYVQNGGWKMGNVGLIEGIYQAFSSFITYAKLWEKQNR
jgi:glycosyltransferase involved in cell wall biosynthesis